MVWDFSLYISCIMLRVFFVDFFTTCVTCVHWVKEFSAYIKFSDVSLFLASLYSFCLFSQCNSGLYSFQFLYFLICLWITFYCYFVFCFPCQLLLTKVSFLFHSVFPVNVLLLDRFLKNPDRFVLECFIFHFLNTLTFHSEQSAILLLVENMKWKHFMIS